MKIVLTVALILSVSLLPVGSFWAIAGAWLVLVIASFVSRIGPVLMVRNSFVALPFVLAALPLIFTKPGNPLATIDLGLFDLTISGEGVKIVATLVFKSWVSVQAATLLILTTRFHDLLHGLERLRVPRLMVAVMGLMYRYLAVIIDEGSRMMRARSARSARTPGSKRPSTAWQARVVGNMVGALFIRSYERSERIYVAMQARGYSGQFVGHTSRPLMASEWLGLSLGLAGLVTFGVAARFWIPAA